MLRLIDRSLYWLGYIVTTSHDLIMARLELLESKPVAIQALWDGDSSGWFIRLSAITEDGLRHTLGAVSGLGDIGLFKGLVPPWPESVEAQKVGGKLADKFGAAFYFPSPDHPEDECPDWRDRENGYPCCRCGILLLQLPDCPWHGICYFCHLAEVREQREAAWTEEERAGPRCFMCEAPAKTDFKGRPACISCAEKYEVYVCENCGEGTLILKSRGHTSLCWKCEMRKLVDTLSEEQRTLILRGFGKEKDRGAATTAHLLGCSRHDADYVLYLLTDDR